MVEDAYCEGQDAYDGGKTCEENPYAKGTELFKAWDEGWLDRAWEEHEED